MNNNSYSAQPNSSPTGGGREGAAFSLRLRLPHVFVTPWYELSEDYADALELCMDHVPKGFVTSSTEKALHCVSAAVNHANKRMKAFPELTEVFAASKWDEIEIQVHVST